MFRISTLYSEIIFKIYSTFNNITKKGSIKIEEMQIQGKLLLYIAKYALIIVAVLFLLFWILVVDKRNKNTNPVIISDIEVAKEDFTGQLWEIEEEVHKLGNGWRIPTIKELKKMDNYDGILLNFDSGFYLSSDFEPEDSMKRFEYSFSTNKIKSVELNKSEKYQRIGERTISSFRVRFVRFIDKNEYEK